MEIFNHSPFYKIDPAQATAQTGVSRRLLLGIGTALSRSAAKDELKPVWGSVVAFAASVKFLFREYHLKDREFTLNKSNGTGFKGILGEKAYYWQKRLFFP